MPEGIFQLVIPFQEKMSPYFTTTPRKEKITECPRLIPLLVHHSTVSLNLEMKNLLMVFHACTAFPPDPSPVLSLHDFMQLRAAAKYGPAGWWQA